MSEMIKDPITACMTEEFLSELSEMQEFANSLYGENKRITDGNYDKSLAAKCINGTFVGRKTENIIAYKGIPYVGNQPVGGLRWKAPVDIAPDDGVYEAYYSGKSPHQRLLDFAALYPQGEDCLHLDIWKADEASAEKKPVMVWIHGGAYEIEGYVDPWYDLSNFVRENPDIIAVSIEYRQGVFGFFHLSHLVDGKDYPDAQNLGLMDQMMALKWIHENIASFGGDPDNVTIFGESAGAGSVTLLPLVEGSHAYIKRVIAESGSPALTRSTEEAIACTNEIMEKVGCKTLSDLQKIDAQTLVDASAVTSMRVAPERDGNYLPLDPYEAYAKGAAKDIDLLHGINKDEMNCYVCILGEDGFIAWGNDYMAKRFVHLTEKEKALAESFSRDVKGERFEHVSRLVDQIMFNAPLIRLSEDQTKGGGKSYTYLFTVESSVPLMRSGHGIELPSVLNHTEMVDETGRVFDETFSKTLRKMWVQFAKTDNPSLSADLSPDGNAKEWPLYDLEDKYVMVLDEFDIHPEKESERKIVDWDRTYFLTKCYWW